MAVKRVIVHGVDIEDKPGSLYRFLSQCSLSGVDFLFMSAYSCGNNRGRVFVGAKDPKKFEEFAKEANLKAVVAAGFIVDGSDRIGAAADVIKGLAENNIRGVAGVAMVRDGRFQMLVIVDAKDADNTHKLLKD
jgi:predicted amino acid-binding ACT domain protein